MYLFDLDGVTSYYYEPTFSYHFNCDGYYNNKQSWLSDDETIKIIWDTTITPNCWRLSGDTLGSLQVININPDTPPINGNWVSVGQNYDVIATEGECLSVSALTINITKNDPSCSCDGSVTVLAQGGLPPYQYSYNNGLTYSNSPIKNGICGDLSFTVMVKDSENNVVSQLVQMSPSTPNVTYSISLVPISLVNLTNNSVEYTFGLNVSPSLPNGVEITFDMVLYSVFKRTPFINSANSTFTTNVVKNSLNITPYSENSVETTSQNNNSGCQSYLNYFTNYTNTYNSLTLTSTDVYQITVVTDYELTCNNEPPIPYENGNYINCCDSQFTILPTQSFIKNGTISGCDCCNIISGGALYE